MDRSYQSQRTELDTMKLSDRSIPQIVGKQEEIMIIDEQHDKEGLTQSRDATWVQRVEKKKKKLECSIGGKGS